MDDAAREALTARVLTDYLPDPNTKLSPSAKLKEELGLDSMSLVSALVRIADELGVDIGSTEFDFSGMKTFSDLVKIVKTF